MPLFKRKATPDQIADRFIRFLPIDDETASSIKEQAETDQISDAVLTAAIHTLRIFSIDYETVVVLGESLQTRLILDAFYAKLEQLIGSKIFHETIKKHIAVYQEGVNTDHKLGAPWGVGNAFAELCNQEMGLEGAPGITLVMFGTDIFMKSLTLVNKYLKSVRIAV